MKKTRKRKKSREDTELGIKANIDVERKGN